MSENHLETIEKYALLKNLIDSNGIIDEDKNLLDLCLDVIYNSNMKAYGLHQLALLLIDWKTKTQEEDK